LRIFQNGNIDATSPEYIGVTTFFSGAGTGAVGVRNGVSGSDFTGFLKGIQVYSKIITASEVRSLYERAGLKEIQETSGFGTPVSTASRGGIANSQLETTPWKFRDTSGRWSIVTSTADGKAVKALRQDTALAAGEYGGIVYKFGNSHFTPQQRAYGSFEWSMYCASRADIRLFAPICAATTLAGGNTDSVRFTATNAVEFYFNGATLAMQTADDYVAAGNWYRFRLTRTFASVYTLWIRGGAYTAWTKVVVSAGSNPYTSAAGITASVCWMAHTVKAGAPAANLWSIGAQDGDHSIKWSPFI